MMTITFFSEEGGVLDVRTHSCPWSPATSCGEYEHVQTSLLYAHMLLSSMNEMDECDSVHIN